MAGFSAAAPQPAPAGGGAQPPMPTQPGGGADLGGAEMATPEEQDAYDRFVARSLELIYGDGFERVLEMLRGGDDPVNGLAVTAATIVARVMDAAEKAGAVPSGDVLLNAGAEVFEDLAELSTKAGIFDFASDKEQFEGAWYRALDEFRVMRQAQGKLDPKVFEQDLAALQQADQTGELAQMLAAAEKRGGAGPAPAEGGPPAAEGEPMPEDGEEDDAGEMPPEDEDGPAEDFPDEEDETPKRPMRR